MSEFTVRAHQTQLPGMGLKGVKNTIAIGSGKGGVGKSTLTVNLAFHLAQLGAKVGILDADIYGPSIPHMLGSSAAEVECVGQHYKPVFAHGIYAMSIGFMTQNQEMPLIWRGPMLAKSLIQLINGTLWDELDYLFIDLPPGTGDIQLSLVQKIPLAGAIIVSTPQTVATMDAEKALLMFQKTNIHILGLIENMSEHICEACGHHSHVFGNAGSQALAQQYQCPLLGTVPLEKTLMEQAEQGAPKPQTAFESIAKAFINEMEKRPLNYADKFPPVVVK